MMKTQMERETGVFGLSGENQTAARGSRRKPGAIRLSSTIFLALLLFAGSAFGQTIKLESPVVKPGDHLPKRYTRAGKKDISPPLIWSNLPENARELVLIFEDVEGQKVHWLAYRIPGALPGLPEGLPAEEVLSQPSKLAGVTQGLTDFSRDTSGYRAPAPVPGKELSLRFTIYALDANLGLQPGLDKPSLLYLIKNRIVGRGDLIVTCRK